MAAHDRWGRPLLAALALGAVMAACAPADRVTDTTAAGSEHPASPATRASPSTAPSMSALPLPAPPELPPPQRRLRVRRRAAVPRAVIRLETFGDELYAPEADAAIIGFTGSGFLIHSNGTAVTNAHVVAGADRVIAHVDGVADDIPAKVLGVDPCRDLAVIRLEGSGYRWLEWTAAQPRVPQKVHAFGHPGGQTAVERRAGRVYDIRADEANPFTSVESVLWTSMRIEPGSSGSAVLDHRDARVVGVVYASEDTEEAALAVPAQHAEAAVTRMRQRHHPADLGIIGYAVPADDARVAGIRVIDVVPGSPAARSRVRVGDVITRLDDVRVGSDRTMTAYCRVLREHDTGDPVTAEVVRGERERVYEAALGPERLRSVGRLDVIDQQLLPVLETAVHDPYEYVTVTDATSTLRVDLPTAWDDVRTGRRRAGADRRVPSVRASNDLRRFMKTRWTSGATIAVAPGHTFELDTLLDDLGHGAVASHCDREGRSRVRSPGWRGRFEVYWPCDDGGTVVAAALRKRGGDASAAVVARVRSPRDLEALDRLIDTLQVDRPA